MSFACNRALVQFQFFTYVCEMEPTEQEYEEIDSILDSIERTSISEKREFVQIKGNVKSIMQKYNLYSPDPFKEPEGMMFKLTPQGFEALHAIGGFKAYAGKIKEKELRELATFRYAKWSAIFGGIVILLWLIDKLIKYFGLCL
jgi:hypothetical protein